MPKLRNQFGILFGVDETATQQIEPDEALAPLDHLGSSVRTAAKRFTLRPPMGIEARDECEESPWSRKAAFLVLVAIIVGYSSIFSVWTIRNHDGLGTFGFDLGIFDQGMWLLSRFKDPFITIMGVHLFGDHTSLILLPLVPLYWVVPTAKVLLIAQSIALGVAALPLFLLGREKLQNSWFALVLAAAFLIHPANSWANFEQFHPDVFGAPLTLAALYLMTKRRWGWFLASVAALLSVKEVVPPMVVLLGIYVAIKHNRKVGLATTTLAILWWCANMWWILPHFNGLGTLDEVKVPFGGFLGLLDAMFTQPGEVIRHLFKEDKPWYLWQLLAPLALTPLLAPSLAAIAAAPLATNLLVDWWYGYHIEYHYHTMIVAVFAAAAVYGIARMKNGQARGLLSILVLVTAVAGAYQWGPTPFAKEPAPLGDPSHPAASSLAHAITLIPADARVSAYYSYVPHLSHRAYIYEFATPWRTANWADGSLDGTRLPEAEAVEYIVLPADPTAIGTQDRLVLDELQLTYSILFEDAYVRVLKRSDA